MRAVSWRNARTITLNARKVQLLPWLAYFCYPRLKLIGFYINVMPAKLLADRRIRRVARPCADLVTVPSVFILPTLFMRPGWPTPMMRGQPDGVLSTCGHERGIDTGQGRGRRNTAAKAIFQDVPLSLFFVESMQIIQHMITEASRCTLFIRLV